MSWYFCGHTRRREVLAVAGAEGLLYGLPVFAPDRSAELKRKVYQRRLQVASVGEADD